MSISMYEPSVMSNKAKKTSYMRACFRPWPGLNYRKFSRVDCSLTLTDPDSAVDNFFYPSALVTALMRR